jgi:hypothetical protein
MLEIVGLTACVYVVLFSSLRAVRASRNGLCMFALPFPYRGLVATRTLAFFSHKEFPFIFSHTCNLLSLGALSFFMVFFPRTIFHC